MKKLYLISFIFTIVLTSCGGNNLKKIKGQWYMSSFESNQYVQNEENYQNTIDQIIRTTSINFEEDKTFAGTIWNDTSFGTWNLKGDSLIITDLANRSKFKVKIITLDFYNLVLEENDGQVIERLYFIKE